MTNTQPNTQLDNLPKDVKFRLTKANEGLGKLANKYKIKFVPMLKYTEVGIIPILNIVDSTEVPPQQPTPTQTPPPSDVVSQ